MKSNHKSSYVDRTGHSRARQCHADYSEKKNIRRINALVRLNQQLESKVKENNGKSEPLTESDVKRIKNEISILNRKIK